MRDVVKSDTWKAIKTTTKELEHLPNRMMREAGLEDDFKELNNHHAFCYCRRSHQDNQTSNHAGE